MKYNKLFEKGKIGNVEIKNRVVVTSMGTGIADDHGNPSKEYIDYVTERAKGGLGLFFTEIVRIDEIYGNGGSNCITLTRPSHVVPWRRLADSVHKYGGKIFAQLWHPGRQTNSIANGGKGIVSSGDVAGMVYPEKPRPLTKEEIAGLIKSFATGAKLAQLAKIDGVELHSAHGYLFHQFFAPMINNRTDEYGGNFENRTRFITEVINAIRQTCGCDFPISVRISAEENIPGGYTLEDGVKYAKYLESLGIDAINISNGLAESSFTIQEPPTFQQGWKIKNAREIKKHVKIPVIATSVIRQPDFAEQLLEEGSVDFIANSRGHLADPHWCNKAKRGEDLDIRHCISCLYCFNELFSLRDIRCAVNPKMGRESELANPCINGNGRTVAIIGGGPAGLESSIVLSQRGFKPVIFEKSDKLGGALQLANKPLHKEKIDWLIDNMVYQAKKANVDIRLNTEATIDKIKEINPYAVFVATGCMPIDIPFTGIDKPHVYSVVDYLNDKVKFKGKSIAVIGGGTTGCEAAEKLATEGNNVTVVEMRPDVGLDMYLIPRRDFMLRMKNLNIENMVNTKLCEITDNGILCIDTITNERLSKDFDAVIMSLGFKSDNNVTDAIEKEFENVIVLGDALKVRKIAEAIYEGHTRAFTLE